MATELLFTEQKTVQMREGTYGTDQVNATLEANTALRFDAYTDVSVTQNVDFRERAINRPAFGNNRGQAIRKNLSFSVSGIVPCPATAGDEPFGISDFIVASGFGEVLVDNTTATYAPSTTATAGLTVYHFMRHVDEYKHRLIYGTGIRGNLSITGSVRDYATFTFTGESKNFPVGSTLTSNPHGYTLDLAYFAADGTILLAADGDTPGGTFDGTAAETTNDLRGLMLEPDAVLTVASTAFPISDFTLDLGNTVKVKEATSASTEVAGVYLTGRNVTLNVTLQDTGAAFEKALDMLHANTEGSSTLVLTDGLGTGGTTLTLTFPKLQVRNVEGPTDSEGLAAWTIPLQANGTWTDGIGDDEVSLVWSVTA